MRDRTKNTILFLFTLALAGGIYLWYYPLDRGSVSITVDQSDYWIMSSGKSAQCPSNPCVITLKTGGQTLTIQKDGFFPVKTESQVKRFKTDSITIQLKKIPTLKESLVVPAEPVEIGNKPLPAGISKASLLAPTWDSKGEKLAYVDRADDKLKIWSDGTTRTVTPLANLAEGFRFQWAPDNATLAGTVDEDLYLIDTQKASRKKTPLGFVSKNTKWSPKNDFLLLNDAKGRVYKMEMGGGPSTPETLEVDLSQTTWDQEGRLVYYAVDGKENQTKVLAYDMAMDESTEIVTKYDFPISRIAKDANGNIYFFNPKLKSWFILDY
jgi:WD40 repeat protein